MMLSAVCTLDVASCSPRISVLEAARLMRQKHTGDLVVVDDGGDEQQPIGVITDRDIVVEVLANDLNPATTTVGSIIRHPVVVAHDSEEPATALERMRTHGVRRIPIVSQHNRLVGILTVDDLLKLLASEASTLTEIVSRQQHHERLARQ
jgi:CBS domain-containing protein